MDPREVSELIDSLLEGDISEADFLRLEAELSVDASLRREYLRRVTLSTLLETEASAQSTNITSPVVVGRPPKLHTWTRVAGGVGMALAIVALIMVIWRRDLAEFDAVAPGVTQQPQPAAANTAVEGAEEEARGYAVISGQDTARWEDGVARATGSLLPTGDLNLSTGIIQLELFSGVAVVVEGPAEFSVTSPMKLVVHSGKVRARVPEPAHGFQVSTRDGDIVDLGTDFAVDVGKDRSELHVLEGEVELRAAGKSARLEMGQAVRLSANDVTSLEADTERFLAQKEIADRLQQALKSRREHWLEWTHRLREHPDLVALYQLGVGEDGDDGRSGRRVANRSNSAGGASEGAVVAAARTTDRWQHRDGALDFSPTGSRIRLTIPGEYQSLTLMCWVKIHSLDRWYNSLFLTDGHEQHEPHWQIMDDGRLFFSVKKRDQWDPSKGEKDKHIYYSPSFWNTSLSGQWLMIATVYDVDSRSVMHYVNGEQISSEVIPDEYLVERVRVGNASLCNWSLPERDEPRFAVRNLNGSLDEFAMFGAALSPKQIREMYEHGKP